MAPQLWVQWGIKLGFRHPDNTQKTQQVLSVKPIEKSSKTTRIKLFCHPSNNYRFLYVYSF